MSLIQATGSGTYFQYVQQARTVNGQSQDVQVSNQNQTTDSIVKLAGAGHLKNAENILSVQQNQGRGSIVDLTA